MDYGPTSLETNFALSSYNKYYESSCQILKALYCKVVALCTTAKNVFNFGVQYFFFFCTSMHT